MKKLLIIFALALFFGITTGPVFPLDTVGNRISDDKDNRYDVFDTSQADSDADCIADYADNCPLTPNGPCGGT